MKWGDDSSKMTARPAISGGIRLVGRCSRSLPVQPWIFGDPLEHM